MHTGFLIGFIIYLLVGSIFPMYEGEDDELSMTRPFMLIFWLPLGLFVLIILAVDNAQTKERKREAELKANRIKSKEGDDMQ